ncbi:MAG: flagellar hook-associated protein FlgL [Deltaproteobacteria bacterium]|nr:flagellar hook-associated protein FlgL [Deltaproteobacteria bacterium]
MRVTQEMMASNLSRNLSKNTEKLMNAQSVVSSGKQITKASDDPVGMSNILDYRKTLASVDQYSRNISQANSGLNVADATLSDIGEQLNRAKELTLAQTNGTASKEDHQIAAVELQQIRDQIIQLANTKQGNKYLFGGQKTGSPPYDPTHPEAGFQGDDGQNLVVIGDGVTLDTHVSGKQAFAGTTDPVVVLTDLIQGLNADDSSAISSALDSLDQSMTQVTNTRADVGVTLNHLDTTESHLTDFQLNIQALLLNTEGADVTQAVTDLAVQQSAYQASLAASAKIIQPSLLDYI